MGFMWRQKSNRGLSESVEVPASSHVWHTVPAFLPAGRSGGDCGWGERYDAGRGSVSELQAETQTARHRRDAHRLRVTYRGSRRANSASRWGRGEGQRRMFWLFLTAFVLWLCRLPWLICFPLCLSTSCLSVLYFRYLKGAIRIMTNDELVPN